MIWAAAEGVPPEWYGGDFGMIEQLVEELLRRQGRVRELIASFRDSDRQPFPMWEDRKNKSGLRQLEAASSLIM